MLSNDNRVVRASQTLAAAGIESPRFEAQLLLALALGVTRTTVVAGLALEPTEAQSETFERFVRERSQRVPFAYLRGTQEFYGQTFAVNPAVLIPRPETELLVDFALEKICPRDAENGSSIVAFTPSRKEDESVGALFAAPGFTGKNPTFADVGTGSGCIVISIVANCESASGVAFDISAAALAVARRNAEANGVAERLRFVEGSLLHGAAENSFDLIVSNPPYIPTAEIGVLQPEVRDFEPRSALDGGADGLELVRELVWDSVRVLRNGGWLAVELAQGQAHAVQEIFHACGFSKIAARRDLAGIERIVCGQKPVGRKQPVAARTL